MFSKLVMSIIDLARLTTHQSINEQSLDEHKTQTNEHNNQELEIRPENKRFSTQIWSSDGDKVYNSAFQRH